MKTKFTDYLQNVEHSIMRISSEKAERLLTTNDDAFELRSFLKQGKNFPNINKIITFVDWLDSYNNKIFDDWSNYVDISFKQSGQFIYFDIDPKTETEVNKSYKQWYNQLKNKKPVIVYLVDDSIQADPERMEQLYKTVKKMQANRKPTVQDKEISTDPQISNEIDKLKNQLQDRVDNGGESNKDNKSLFDSDIDLEADIKPNKDLVIDKYRKHKKASPQPTQAQKSDNKVKAAINKHK